MAYIYGLIVVGLFTTALHYFTELTNKQKAYIGAFLFILIMLAVAYNKYNASAQEQMLGVVTKYEQGKSVECNGVKVNSSTYSLSIGTYTFIGKENTPHYAEMIPVSSCK
ncbi:hypothetical protein [Sulfurimonas sp.]